MVALTDRPKEVAMAIERRGGVPFTVSISETGVTASGMIGQQAA